VIEHQIIVRVLIRVLRQTLLHRLQVRGASWMLRFVPIVLRFVPIVLLQRYCLSLFNFVNSCLHCSSKIEICTLSILRKALSVSFEKGRLGGDLCGERLALIELGCVA
jgi:hypothetical protein